MLSCGWRATITSMFRVLKDFRRIADALERLASTHLQLVRGQPSDRRLIDLEELVVKLELSRAQWEAEVEAVLMKAEGKLHAANNAESRTRTMKKSYEKQLDPFDLGSDEIEAIVPDSDVPAGEEAGVYEMPPPLETNSKTQALRAKWGL